MLATCVRACPGELWTVPSVVTEDGDRVIVRSYWRIALHAAFFTQLYLGQSTESLQPWQGRRLDGSRLLEDPIAIEPYELESDAEPYTVDQVLAYIGFVRSIVDKTLDTLDLESPDSGFPWYPNISKMSHQLMNLRHIQGHVGQLSELLLAHQIDTPWVSQSHA